MKRPVAHFAGTGRAVPSGILTNHDFASRGIETTHEWIVERTGIHQRHIAENGETTANLAAEAGRHAMARAGVTAGELDVILVATSSPDRLLPATAVDVQAHPNRRSRSRQFLQSRRTLQLRQVRIRPHLRSQRTRLAQG